MQEPTIYKSVQTYLSLQNKLCGLKDKAEYGECVVAKQLWQFVEYSWKFLTIFTHVDSALSEMAVVSDNSALICHN